MGRIIWLTGHSGSGKTTLANELQKEIDCIVLDGNEMRNTISIDADFSRKDRREHNLRVSRLAEVLSKQKDVIVAVIAPMESVREEIDKMCSPIWVYVKRIMPERKGHFYEPTEDYFTVDHDKLSIKESVEKVREYIDGEKKVYSICVGRYQPPHLGHEALFNEVRKEGRNLAIGIRDTKLSEDNPYSISERMEMLREMVPEAKLFIIPDLDEMVHGRRVGWDVREIRLDDDTENISASEIREVLNEQKED